MLKSLRNLVSDSVASAVDRFPATEVCFKAVGRRANSLPLVRTLYLRAVESLSKRWRNTGRQYKSVSIDAQQFVFDVTDFTVSSLYFHNQLFEQGTTRFVLENLNEGGLVLDVGANKGYITILAALQVGSTGRVFSFEPNPGVYRDLAHHLHLNGLTERVQLSTYALSDTDGANVVFYLSNLESNSGLSSLTPQADLLQSHALSTDNTIQVETITLDRFLIENAITKRIDLIKIDVEGAESKVLAGAKNTLAQNPPKTWIIETKRDSGVNEFMQQLGYRTSILDQADDTVNLLCAYGEVSY